MGVVTLVCSCGMRLKAPGAVPGRVGKCPRCGSMLKVPAGPATGPGPASDRVEPEPEPAASPRATRETFIGVRARKPKSRAETRRRSDGLVVPPDHAETRLVVSLGYPLWNSSGLAVLIFLPPLLLFATAPLFAIVPMIASGTAFAVIGIVFMVPQFLLLAAVFGYVLLFLGRVLTTSAAGETTQPRSPGRDLSEIARGLSRWSWAIVVGGLVGGLPPLLYWFWCGDVDWLDRIVLVDLIVPGMAYAQMALLAALIHESPLAANPITVTAAILRLGWSYLSPCLFTGSCLLILAGLFHAVLQITSELGQVVAAWGFWVAALYAAMVVLRRLGLFCFRHAVILDWFPDRAG